MLSKQAHSPTGQRLSPDRFAAWQAQGLSVRAAGILTTVGCNTIEEVARLGRSYFEGRPNCAEKTLAELAALAGWPPKPRTALDTIAQALSMAMDPQEAREAAADVMCSLRNDGFTLTVTPRG